MARQLYDFLYMNQKAKSPFTLAVCACLVLALGAVGDVFPQGIIRVPQDFSDLQQAIDASDKNALIKVAAGTYYGNFQLTGNRSLIGENPQTTILTDDGEGSPDAIITINGDGTFSGFTVTGARGGGLGHAVMITRGSPSITNNIIRDNSFTGLGIHSESYPTLAMIKHNKIYGNGGAGIANYGQYSKSLIENNEIYSNTNVGIVSIYFASPVIRENNLHHNGVGIVVRDDAKAVIIKNNINLNAMVGIQVTSASAARIVDNRILMNGTVGISVDREATAEVYKNSISDNGAEAIYFKGGAQGVVDSNEVSGILPTIARFDKSRVRISNNNFYSMESPKENSVVLTNTNALMGNNTITKGAEVKGSNIAPLTKEQMVYQMQLKPFWELETGLPLDLIPLLESTADPLDIEAKPEQELRMKSCWGIF